MSLSTGSSPAPPALLPSFRARWLLLAVVSSGLLLIAIDNSVLYTALPTLQAELGADASESLWIVNAYPLAMAGLLLGAGTLGDRYGHTRLFQIGLVIFGAASLLAAFSPTPAILIAARALLGAGAAAMMPATLALIRVTFVDPRERNLAVGIWASVSIAGAALGPIVGGLLLEVFWWGSVFLINVPVVVLALVATVFVAPRGGGSKDRAWDLLSSVLALLALSGLVVVIKELARVAESWPLVVSAAAVGTVSGWLFVRRQRRLAYPLLDFAILRIPAVAAGVTAAAASLFAIAGIEFASAQRFQLVAGYSPLEAGALVVAAALGALPTAIVGGAMLHRIGLRRAMSGGLLIGGLGVGVSIALLGAGNAIAIGFAIGGAGLGLVFASASTAIIGNAPKHRAGMASSVEEVSYEFGNLTAVAVVGSLLTAVYQAVVRLPAGAPAGAGTSLGDALTLGEALPEEAAAALSASAGAAYDVG
ncbi:MAG: MFS transporter, partial [Naasia sp.]